MGQILNRIKRIAKSYTNDSDLPLQEVSFDDKDKDLKRIIDELNREKKKEDNSRSNNNTGSGERKSADNIMTAEKAFGILGVSRNADTEQIKSAYKKRVMEYHPDRVSTLGAELKVLAEKKTIEINSAYNFLRKLKGF